MKEREINLVMKYLYNNRCALETEVKNLKQAVRYRRIDVDDCLELMLSIERLETFKLVSRDIITLLKLERFEVHEDE